MAITQRLLTLYVCISIETKQLTIITWCVDGVPSNNRMINYMVCPKMVTIKAKSKVPCLFFCPTLTEGYQNANQIGRK
jgi:hypothetical protein